jgi:hypothetical protein
MGIGQQPAARIDESLPRNPVSVRAPGNPVSQRDSEQHILRVTSRAGTRRHSEETRFLSTDNPDARGGRNLQIES